MRAPSAVTTRAKKLSLLKQNKQVELFILNQGQANKYTMYRSQIIGTGSSVPQKVLTNKDLESLVDTDAEWIITRTGIKERRIALNGEPTSKFAYQASCNALEMAGVSPDEIGMIIVGTVTPDMSTPSVACIVQDKLKASRTSAFDISAGCTGFIYSLSIADSCIKAGMCEKVLVIGAETLSKITDYQDRATCIIFADGAGAAVLAKGDGEQGILSTHLFSDGSFGNLLYMPGGGSALPASPETVKNREHYLKMDGNKVFKIAVKSLEEAARTALSHNSLTEDSVDLLIPHQANSRIIQAITKRLNLPPEKVFSNIDKYGNTSAASVPIALDDANRQKRIKKDDLVLLDAFGSGFTWGSALLRW
jgi:3-oxoacyl-[acyl-carrier-protein] synthase-3